MTEESGFVSDEKFASIVSSVPLVSVDLVIENHDREFLLGLRENRPARGFWFVPGGRILKNEGISQAIARVMDQEVGLSESDYETRLLGVFEHFYDDSAFDHIARTNTHYVAIGYHISVNQGFETVKLDSQHSELRWFSIEQIEDSQNVHRYSQDYILNL